ncbi:hypothetical protein [Clostridium ganghwense]|uniref:Lipoprotein n=1 Tax=Clostridium ganghwense TaxID=312089 RepID=A0ABT4CJ84_9CLOT|nr:hypothetical protein [Clostridium ganghwense]MCY6369113.1 hypothetical protein [Clostridium ganghwense]
MFLLQIIPEKYISTIFSTAAIITGSLVGGLCSWIITKHSTKDNRRYDYNEKINKICENINIIRLDICNAIFQSIRTLKYFNNENSVNKYPIPINKDYSKVVASLTNKFELKEMSYIYQLYGIIETLNTHIKDLHYDDKQGCELIKQDCELFLKKLYGENFIKIIEIDIEETTYQELYDNELIKIDYREVLKKLDKNTCTKGYK